MCRSKGILAAVLCLCLMSPVGLAQSPNLISEDMIAANVVNFETETVEYGEIEQKFSVSGELYLPYTYELYPKTGGLKLEQINVKRDDFVRAGDVLVVFSSNVDEVALEEKKRLFERTRDAFELECVARQASIDEMHMDLLEVRDSYEAKMLELETQRAEIALEKYVWQMETELENIQRDIDSIEKTREDSVITAPVDGLILKVVSRRTGDRIDKNELMITMCRTDGALVAVKNQMGNLRYGMEVEITSGNANSKKTMTGRVVGADYMLPESQRTNMVYVKPDAYDPQKTPVNNIKVNGTNVRLGNVMTIPRDALSLEMGRHFVLKYSDGMARKRYVNAHLIRQQVVVLQGIEPGEAIITD